MALHANKHRRLRQLRERRRRKPPTLTHERRKKFIPNGCTASPDGLGAIQWKDCCDLHDLAYYVGGWRGLLNGAKLKSDIALAQCMMRHWRRSADDPQISKSRRAGRLVGGPVLGSLYFLAVSTVGSLPFFWPWREREVPSHEMLASLATPGAFTALA